MLSVTPTIVELNPPVKEVIRSAMTTLITTALDLLSELYNFKSNSFSVAISYKRKDG